jgi:putative thioredoxin
MSLSPFVFDATRENFRPLVLGNSDRGLVLVYFWSSKAGPCLLLMPRLVRLATEYGGKFLLVMLNTDELGGLAREWGVTSVPTVKFFRRGRVVHTIHGAESDAVLRKAIEPHLARASDRAHAEAVALFQQGDTERAYRLLAQAVLDDPENLRLPVDLAKLMMLNREHQRAYELLGHLPRQIEEGEAAALLTHLTLVLAAESSPDEELLRHRILAVPDDLEARLQLAARRLLADDYGGALDELLEITRRDHDFRDQIGRRAVLAILAMPALPEGMAARYRARASLRLCIDRPTPSVSVLA